MLPPESVKPYVGYAIGYDNNVLRLPSSEAALEMGAGTNLSDVTRRGQFGFAVDKSIGLQKLTADFNVTNVLYKRFVQLNHLDKNFSANWNWHVGDHVEGNAGLTYSQGQTPFIDFHLLAANIRTQESGYANGAWEFYPGWRVHAGLDYTKLWYDLASQQSGNNVRHQTDLGLDYLAASGSTLGVQLRHTSADFPNPDLDGDVSVFNSYKQDEIKAKIDWLLTAKTRLHFLGGWVSRKQDAFSKRNFDGFNSRVSADWQSTESLAFGVEAWREIGAVDELSTVYSLNRGMRLTAIWQYSKKIRVVGRYSYQSRDFSQSSANGTIGSVDDNDVLRDIALTFTYNPTPKWEWQLSGRRSTQVLAHSSGGYVSNGVMLNTRYTF
ncbi:hypothetical protein HAV38_19400 [Glaciimonas immobilis]|nr:hypothetical protein HAV38_19400 [Glaciimonas immobilis]